MEWISREPLKSRLSFETTIPLVRFIGLLLNARNAPSHGNRLNWGHLRTTDVELSFHTEKIKKASMNEGAARKALGNDLARAFFGQVADMREAMFLGELPDQPVVIAENGTLILNYSLGESVTLEVEPVSVGQIGAEAWREVHRVKLVRVRNQDETLL